MHFIIVLTSLITTHEAQSPIGGGSAPLSILNDFVKPSKKEKKK